MDKILSIIIPTYNAEQFLDKGLPTYILEEQKLREQLEVLIINDGTKDHSVEVAQKYVDQYPNLFTIISKENGGHGSAINLGAKHATGKYMKVVDADDWVNTDVLSEVITILQSQEVDAVLTSYECYDIGKQEYIPKLIETDSFGPYSLSEILAKWDQYYWGLTFHGIIYNTAFYQSLNYQLKEKVFYEDQEYATVPMAYAKTVGMIPKKLYVYRVGDVNQSVSMQSSLKRLDHYEAVILRMGSHKEQANHFAAGGQDYWMKKTSKFANDYYELCLVQNPNKKQCRKRLQQFHEQMKEQAPALYQETRKNYYVFWVMNHLHISGQTYRNRVLPMIKAGRSAAKGRNSSK